MKRITDIIAIVINCIILTSCNYDSRIERQNDEKQGEAVSSCIEEAFNYFLKLTGDTSDISSVYVIIFDKQYPKCQDSYTKITIGRLNSIMPTSGLKGVTLVCNRKAVIIDEYNLGDVFYNLDSLKSIDIDRLVLPDEISLCCSYIIEKNQFFIEGIQPDDFEAISIR